MNVRGGLVSAGNTLLTCPQNVGARGRPRPRASESCLDANNNDRDMVYVNVAASGHFNSSTATLSIPAGARVVRAYLYWGADLARGVANGPETGAPAGETPETNDRWRQAELRVGSGSFVNVDATNPLRNGQWAGVASWYSQPGNRPGFAYQVRANVTTEVRNGIQVTKRRGRLGAQLLSVTVANVQAGRGFNRHAGWNLLVAWESPTSAWRHVSIFDGFDFVQVQGGQQLVVGPLDFTGFETPASGAVDAHAITWTYEGDRAIVGDYLALGKLGVPCGQLPHRSNAANPIDNFFNSSISSGGANVPGRTPAYVNQLGYDLDTLALPEGAIPNNANGAAACLGTVGDTYFFGGIAFDVLIRAPNVHIAKSADRSEAAPGEVVTYTTTVTNPTRGPDDPLYPTPTVPATNLVVTDVLPSGLDFVDFVSNPGGACDYVVASRAIRCAVGTLGIDATFSYIYHARVSGGAQGAQANPLVNAACYLSNSEDQPDVTFTGCDEATVTVPAAPYVDLGVVKIVSDDVVEPGTNLTWRVTGTNHGPGTSTSFVLADELPAGVTFVSATASPELTCTTPAVGAGGAVVCTAPLVSAGASVTLTIVGAVPSATAEGALLLNVATVSGNENEPVPDPHPNRDTAETTVVVPNKPIPPPPPPDPEPDGPPQPPQPPPTPPFVPPGLAGTLLKLAKHGKPAQARRGDTITFRLRVTNTGEASAKNVHVCDTPLPGLRLVSARGFRREGSRACTTIPTLGVGKHVTLTLTGRITVMASSFVFNRASAQAKNAGLVRASAVVRVSGGIRCPSGLRPAAAPNC
jgi:large repetitive protein